MRLNTPTHAFEVLHAHVPPDSQLYRILLPHSSCVAHKAVQAAARLGLSREQKQFIEEAALLHDIGVCRVRHPAIGAHGDLPYLRHGVEGRAILEAEGLPRHARVAENHVGSGILAAEVRANKLDLPERDMIPETVEEELVAWADYFFSKNPDSLWEEFSLDNIEQRITRYGERSLAVFRQWQARFAG